MTTSEFDPLKALDAIQLEAPSAGVSERILAQCTRKLKPARGLSQSARLALSLGAVGAGIAWLAAATSLGGGHSHALAEAGLYGAAGWGFMLAILLFAGLGQPPGGSARSRRVFLLCVLTLAAFFAYLGIGAEAFGSLSGAFTASGTLSCAAHTLCTGAVVAGAAMLLWRGTDPFAPKLSGALLGLLGGLSGALGVGIICPSDVGWHLWVGHGVGVLVLIGLGSAAGRKWLAP
jgi:hypothetical protein